MTERLETGATAMVAPPSAIGQNASRPSRDTLHGLATALGSLAPLVLRYGLVAVVAWIGAMKFTAYEASGIQPLIASSPLLSWLYWTLSVQGASNLLGVVELAIAVMVALRPVSPGIAVIGSAGAVAMFATTLTFLFSAPGWEPSLGGFPAISAFPGQFLLKDIVLLGAALWSLGDAASATISGAAN